ncbi:MAG: hypothetical protein COB38_00375 [Gammaproteobacteria bacterium]|nr:MAG: hypothetical protein COB38_00375 [Gammaproteobacteria bacterium]
MRESQGKGVIDRSSLSLHSRQAGEVQSATFEPLFSSSTSDHKNQPFDLNSHVSLPQLRDQQSDLNGHPNLKNTTIQNILVVDPDSKFSSTVADYLTLFGFQVSHKNSLVSALDYLKNHNCDLIFVSDNFEQIHPITSLRKFKEISDSKIVIIATRGDDQLAVELIKAGASDYLSRRVKDKDILSSLASLLDRLGNQAKKALKKSPNKFHTPNTDEFKPVNKPVDKLGERLVHFYEGASRQARYDSEIAGLESTRSNVGTDMGTDIGTEIIADIKSESSRPLVINRPDFSRADFDRADFDRENHNRAGFNREDHNRPDFNREDRNRPDFNGPDFNLPEPNEKDLDRINVFERLSLESDFNSKRNASPKTKSQSMKQTGIANITDLPGNLISLDQNLNIDVINHSASSILGFSVQENIQKSVLEFIPQSLQKSFQQELIDIAENCHVVGGHAVGEEETGNQKQFETVLTIKNGDTIPVNCHLSCYYSRSESHHSDLNKSKEISYLLSFDDISHVKSAQAKQQYQAMWNNVLHNYSYRFINFKLADFPSELTSIISEAASFFKLDRVSIYLFDRTSSSAKIYLEWLKSGCASLKQFSKKIELQNDAVEFSALLAGEVQLLTPEETIKTSADLSCFGLSEHYAQVGAKSTVILPLERHTSSDKNRIMGWLSLDFQTSNNQWLQEDLMLISPLSKLISEAFSRRAQEEHRRVTHQKLSENHGRLSEQAFTDGLTNLANRRYFDKVLESEVRRASREQANIAVLFCDIDFFKAYNDTYGHLEGDVCLKAVAMVLKNEFQRASDFVARFGGEEFAVILSGMSHQDAQDSAEKLIQKVIDQNILHHGSPLGQIAISIGIACVSAPNPGDAIKILSKADKALYKAKSNGRNRVEMVTYTPN